MSEEKSQVSRRSFMEKLAAGAALAAAGGVVANLAPGSAEAATMDQVTAAMNAGAFGMVLPGDAQAQTLPALSSRPNILMIMVDQLRLPQLWLTSTGANNQQYLLDTYFAPNLAFLRKNSCQFAEFYAAAQNCTPSRGTLATGCYAPQTGIFATQTGNGEPDLDTRFPTFGQALQDIAGYPANSIFWFGKWHLSDGSNMPAYGFNSNQTQPNWPSTYGSPNGGANEGTNGATLTTVQNRTYPTTPKSLACDAAIAADFTYYWTHYPPSAPWFAAVSLVNPHDMSDYTGFFPPNTNYEPWIPGESTGPQGDGPGGNFSPSVSNYGSSPLFSALPSQFNYETPATLGTKGVNLQTWYLNEINFATANGGQAFIVGGTHPNQSPGTTNKNDFIDYLNWYYYMLAQVDVQIGNVLNAALPGYSNTGSGNPSTTTAVIFLSDHGDYAGSHCLRSKGGAVYDEVLRLPLYVMLPGQKQAFTQYQMCSMVDVFRLVVELGLGTTYQWSSNSVYKDQNARQSLLSFLGNNNAESRLSRSFGTTPVAYILSTTDELLIDPNDPLQTLNYCTLQNHVVCLRTKSEDNPSSPPSAYTGAKYSIYSKWVLGATNIDIGTPQQVEFYDYQNLGNRSELGNNFSSTSPSTLQNEMSTALGNGPLADPSNPDYTPAPPNGLIGSELRAALQGTTRDGSTPLSSVTASALEAWASWAKTKIQAADSSCTS